MPRVEICFAVTFCFAVALVGHRRYNHLPSVPCGYFGVIVSGLCYENMNSTQSFGEIFAALRMRYGSEVGLSVISQVTNYSLILARNFSVNL